MRASIQETKNMIPTKVIVYMSGNEAEQVARILSSSPTNSITVNNVGKEIRRVIPEGVIR